MDHTAPTRLSTSDSRIRAACYAVALALILLVAAGLRLHRLPELPLGLHYDEAANGVLASEIARGAKTPVFIPSYTGKEVLFFYWAGLWIRLLGATPLALRLSAALAGLATVAATVWAVRELLHGQRDAGWVALLTGAFLATSFWHLVLTRYGFRAVTQPLTQALTVAALWRGLRKSTPQIPNPKSQVPGGLPWLLLGGLFCGLTAYTYLAARAFPIPLAAAALTLLVADRGHRRARLGQLAIFVAVAALTTTPLAHYWLTHPGSFLTRTQQVAAASWAEALNGVRACLGMFFLRGDPYVRFNLPHRPLFDPITAILFLLGIVAVAKPQIPNPKSQTLNPKPPASNIQHPTSNVQHPIPSTQYPVSPPPAPRLPCAPAPLHTASRVFLLTTLPIMLLPSALATGEITPSNLRTVGLLPFIYVFPALALSALISAARRRLGSLIRKSPSATCKPRFFIVQCSLLILTLIVLTAITAAAYFRDWAPSTALYRAADGDLVDVAAYLNQAELTGTTPYVASVHYRHPTLAFLAEDYGAVRWLRGGRTVVFPVEGADGEHPQALLIYPRSASGDLAWVESVVPDGSLVAAPPGPDGTPAFHAYRVGSEPDLAPTRPLTADLGHAALLLGYDVLGEPRSGERAEVAVWWRVLSRPDPGDHRAVARLTDRWGFVWGETQPFHYPSEQWTPGERVVDHLAIPVAPGAPPGDYWVHFSLYSASADAALPVLDGDGRYAGTDVALPLRLARAAAPADPDELSIRTPLDARAGGLTLLGATLDTTRARPGEEVHLTLFWRADEAPLPDYDVHLALGETALYAGSPVHTTYPTSGWTVGEVVADRYGLRLPRDMGPGNHPLRLRLEDPATGRAVRWSSGPEEEESEALALGTVAVQRVDRTFEVPPISHPLSATLGEQVELLGYDLSSETVAPGDTLTLTLYWRALAEMDESYTVFAHLVAPDGALSGQRDSRPLDGTYPTTLWLPGEVMADTYEIPVHADAALGAHRLAVGMYVAQTGARLLIADTADDAVFLQAVVVISP